MKRKNGFTLIEVLAVIIILGIVMTIAIPAVSKYIVKTDDSTYASNVIAYLETARAEYEMKEYGSLLKENEIMIVPIEYIKLEKGRLESPYGDFELSQSYIIISPYKNGYQFYANVVDDVGKGVSMKTQLELDNESIEDNLSDIIEPYETYYDSTKDLVLNKNTYKMCEIRDLETPDETYDDAIIVLCGDGEFINPDASNDEVALRAVNRRGKEIKNGNYSNSGLDFTFSRVDETSTNSEIYYCQDTTDTCIPNIKVANGATITDYNTITSDYFIRYKLVGVNGLGKEYSYNAMFDMEGPNCTFNEVVPIIYQTKTATVEMECIDSLSKISKVGENISTDSFTLSNNNVLVESINASLIDDGVKYVITLKGQGHGVTNIEFKENQIFDNAENGNNSVNIDVTSYGLFKVTLDNQGATTQGTGEIYALHNEGWYSNSGATTSITSITKPVKEGYIFYGYYTESNGTGIQIIDENGNIMLGTESVITSDITIYANWNEKPPETVKCNAGTYLKAGESSCSTCLANHWCPGGTFLILTGGGLNSCSSGYTNAAGNSSKSSCCKTVTTKKCNGDKIGGECYSSSTNSGWAYLAGSQWKCVRGTTTHCYCAVGCINGTTKTINAGQRCDCRAKIAWTTTNTKVCE